MTTFLLIWYACGWANIGIWCLDGKDDLNGGHFLLFMGLGAVALLFGFLLAFRKVVLWRKP